MRYLHFYVISVLFSIMLSVHPAFSANLDVMMQESFEKLSDSYVKQFPVKSTKRGLAVLPFKEESEKAKSKGLGNTVREMLSGIVLTSQSFYLVDRDSLEASLEEMKLSMAGIVDEKSMTEAGKISGVRVFLTGSVSELQGKMLVTMKLVDAETGKVVSQESVMVKTGEMLDKRREIEFSYIARHGLGINFQESMVFITCPLDNYSVNSTDVFVNYRPWLWLNFKLGINMTNFKINYQSLNDIQAIYPLMPAADLPERVNYNEATMDLIGPYFGVDVNWTPTEKFTLGLGISASFYNNPRLVQHYYPASLWRDGNNDDIIDPGESVDGGMFDVEQEYYSLQLFRIELKPQYFVTPRFTVGLYLAYIISPSLKVYKSVINNEYTGFPGESGDGSSTIEQEMKKKYYGMPLTILGDNKNANDLSFNGGYAVGLSINFYF